jgi:tetratricopeptide (TPR) repeat protein
MRENHWAVANADWARLIALTGEAVRHEPGNVTYRHWLNAHRWRAVSRITDARTGAAVLTDRALRSAERIADDLERARVLCPTFGPNYSLLGQLRRFVLGRREAGDLIRRGRALAPCSPTACLSEAMLLGQEGRHAESLEAFRRVLALDAGRFHSVVRACVVQLGRPELAVEVAAGDAGRMLAVAEVLSQAGQVRLAGEARRAGVGRLHAECEEANAPAHTLARAAEMCLRDGQFERAAAYYRRALSRDCSKVAWRLSFAKALAEAGRLPEARRQAGICLKLMPGMPEARRLVAELTARRSGDDAI